MVRVFIHQHLGETHNLRNCCVTVLFMQEPEADQGGGGREGGGGGDKGRGGGEGGKGHGGGAGGGAWRVLKSLVLQMYLLPLA